MLLSLFFLVVTVAKVCAVALIALVVFVLFFIRLFVPINLNRWKNEKLFLLREKFYH